MVSIVRNLKPSPYRLHLAEFVLQLRDGEQLLLPALDLGSQLVQLLLVLDHLLARLQQVGRRAAVGGVPKGLPGLQLSSLGTQPRGGWGYLLTGEQS